MKSKPIIRWAGSKRKLLPILLENIPDYFERYVEPFCGSACLFFELDCKKALLCDINFDLVNALNEIKSNPTIRNDLIAIPPSSEEYYRIRSIDPISLTNKERAIRFLYLNRYCFNGVYRTNSSGKFNVPKGTNTGGFPDEKVFKDTSKKLKYAKILVSNYNETLENVKKNDFVYLDPPYSKSGRFTGEYGVGSFNSSEIENLKKSLSEIDKKGAKFLLSYKFCEDTVNLLKSDYLVKEISVKRHISGFKKGWDDEREIIVKNF